MALPLDTKVSAMATAMGISAKQVAALSPAAKKLTKAQLISLGNWSGKGKVPDHLTVKDIDSIRNLFGPSLSKLKGSAAMDINCCCCPCCCATAIMKPMEQNAEVSVMI